MCTRMLTYVRTYAYKCTHADARKPQRCELWHMYTFTLFGLLRMSINALSMFEAPSNVQGKKESKEKGCQWG